MALCCITGDRPVHASTYVQTHMSEGAFDGDLVSHGSSFSLPSVLRDEQLHHPVVSDEGRGIKRTGLLNLPGLVLSLNLKSV